MRSTKRDGGVTTSYFYDGANRLLRESDGTDTTTYTYDRAGNRTRKVSPTEDIAYTWDAAGRMTRVDNGATIEYQYNADGQRVLRDTGSEYARYLYDFSKLLQENDADGVEEATYTSSLQDEYGDLISQFRPADGSSYYSFDGVGSVEHDTAQPAPNRQTYKYTAFGETAGGAIGANYCFSPRLPKKQAVFSSRLPIFLPGDLHGGAFVAR